VSSFNQYKHDDGFTNTGSGQTRGKVKRRGVFFTGIAPENPAGASDGHLIQSMDEDVIAIHLK
jgi:hypothetical protein